MPVTVRRGWWLSDKLDDEQAAVVQGVKEAEQPKKEAVGEDDKRRRSEERALHRRERVEWYRREFIDTGYLVGRTDNDVCEGTTITVFSNEAAAHLYGSRLPAYVHGFQKIEPVVFIDLAALKPQPDEDDAAYQDALDAFRRPLYAYETSGRSRGHFESPCWVVVFSRTPATRGAVATLLQELGYTGSVDWEGGATDA